MLDTHNYRLASLPGGRRQQYFVSFVFEPSTRSAAAAAAALLLVLTRTSARTRMPAAALWLAVNLLLVGLAAQTLHVLQVGRARFVPIARHLYRTESVAHAIYKIAVC